MQLPEDVSDQEQVWMNDAIEKKCVSKTGGKEANIQNHTKPVFFLNVPFYWGSQGLEMKISTSKLANSKQQMVHSSHLLWSDGNGQRM